MIDHKNSLAPRFLHGIYVGSRPRSGEHLVATEDGVIRCRDVRRLTADRRYDAEALKKVKGTPWAPLGGEVMLEAPTSIKFDKPAPMNEDEEYVPEFQMKRMITKGALRNMDPPTNAEAAEQQVRTDDRLTAGSAGRGWKKQ